MRAETHTFQHVVEVGWVWREQALTWDRDGVQGVELARCVGSLTSGALFGIQPALAATVFRVAHIWTHVHQFRPLAPVLVFCTWIWPSGR